MTYYSTSNLKRWSSFKFEMVTLWFVCQPKDYEDDAPSLLKATHHRFLSMVVRSSSRGAVFLLWCHCSGLRWFKAISHMFFFLFCFLILASVHLAKNYEEPFLMSHRKVLLAEWALYFASLSKGDARFVLVSVIFPFGWMRLFGWSFVLLLFCIWNHEIVFLAVDGVLQLIEILYYLKEAYVIVYI